MPSKVKYTIDYIGGNCPIQLEGQVGSKKFYFRARGNRWSVSIGEDPIPQPDWVYLEQYGEEKFAAGWMSEEEAIVFLKKALQLYADGHPGSTHLDLKRQQA
jgi:hypothetical protein